ncbi:sac1 phosphoinositide phosphatase, partial [Cystoisospora suis]
MDATALVRPPFSCDLYSTALLLRSTTDPSEHLVFTCTQKGEETSVSASCPSKKAPTFSFTVSAGGRDGTGLPKFCSTPSRVGHSLRAAPNDAIVPPCSDSTNTLFSSPPLKSIACYGLFGVTQIYGSAYAICIDACTLVGFVGAAPLLQISSFHLVQVPPCELAGQEPDKSPALCTRTLRKRGFLQSYSKFLAGATVTITSHSISAAAAIGEPALAGGNPMTSSLGRDADETDGETSADGPGGFRRAPAANKVVPANQATSSPVEGAAVESKGAAAPPPGVRSHSPTIAAAWLNLLCDGLCEGAFYFSPTLDLTKNLQTQLKAAPSSAELTDHVEEPRGVGEKTSRADGPCCRFQETEGQNSAKEDAGGSLWTDRFSSNRHFMEPITQQTEKGFRFCAQVIQGYVGWGLLSYTVDRCIYLCVISRRDGSRTGARFHSRGLNAAGSASNLVETEQILLIYSLGDGASLCDLAAPAVSPAGGPNSSSSSAGPRRRTHRAPREETLSLTATQLLSRSSSTLSVFSFVQIRGSIPLVWSQTPTLNHSSSSAKRPLATAEVVRFSGRKISGTLLARSSAAGSRCGTPEMDTDGSAVRCVLGVVSRAVDSLHHEEIAPTECLPTQRRDSSDVAVCRTYGPATVVNLVNKKGTEKVLGDKYEHVVAQQNNKNLSFVWFDFHQECSKMRWGNLSRLCNEVQRALDHQHYFHAVCKQPLEGGDLGGWEVVNDDGSCLSSVADSFLSWRGVKRTLPGWGKIEVFGHQCGVFRVNCIDCLDRTNVVESVFAKRVLSQLLRVFSGHQAYESRSRGLPSGHQSVSSPPSSSASSACSPSGLSSRQHRTSSSSSGPLGPTVGAGGAGADSLFATADSTTLTQTGSDDPFAPLPFTSPEGEQLFRNLWTDNADALSLLYSGTPALKTDFTRTGIRTRWGALSDARNSVIRYLLNNFFDGYKQDCFTFFSQAASYPNSSSKTGLLPPKRFHAGLRRVLFESLLLFLFLLFVLPVLPSSIVFSGVYGAGYRVTEALLAFCSLPFQIVFSLLPTLFSYTFPGISFPSILRPFAFPAEGFFFGSSAAVSGQWSEVFKKVGGFIWLFTFSLLCSVAYIFVRAAAVVSVPQLLPD